MKSRTRPKNEEVGLTLPAWSLASSTLTLTELGTLKASTPESILPMTMMPGSGISWPSLVGPP
jgi:hypothetical protein